MFLKVSKDYNAFIDLLKKMAEDYKGKNRCLLFNIKPLSLVGAEPRG
jgi:hypothetical protein